MYLGLALLLFLICRHSLLILESSPLSPVCTMQTFSEPLALLSVPFRVFFFFFCGRETSRAVPTACILRTLVTGMNVWGDFHLLELGLRSEWIQSDFGQQWQAGESSGKGR